LSNPHDFHTPQSSYSRDDLLKSGEGGYFGPGNAQLPAPPMLMMDRITELSLDGGEFGKGHDRDFWSLAPRFIQQWEESRLLLKRDARYF